jgi:hypothetical protein
MTGRVPAGGATAASAAAATALPRRYAILPAVVPLRVPGFLGQARDSDFVLAPDAIDCRDWFAAFAARVIDAVEGRRYLPVCRMSDGEFLLLFGPQPPSPRYPLGRRLYEQARYLRSAWRYRRRGLQAFTARGVSSGDLSAAEIRAVRPAMAAGFAEVARRGVLGLHLSYGDVPHAEQFFPSLAGWLAAAGITLTPFNYVPFYFVYALLRGPTFAELIGGRRVLVVHSAVDGKRRAITAALQTAGASGVEWMRISPSRAFDERLDLGAVHAQPDLVLLGAGVGKGLLFGQLEPLGVPCLDAGFAFEVWADPDKQWDRPYMTPDTDFDPARVRFLPPEKRALLHAARRHHEERGHDR